METAKQARSLACRNFHSFWQEKILPRITEACKSGRFQHRFDAKELAEMGLPMEEFESGFRSCMSQHSGYVLEHTHTYGSYKGYNGMGDKVMFPTKAVDGVRIVWA